jgi:hypothetical protein
MSTMNSTPVIPLDRNRRVTRARDARRRLRDAASEHPGEDRRVGRMWLNGAELGGTRAALAHLDASFD